MKGWLNFSSRFPLAGPQAAVALAVAMQADSLWTVDHLMGTQHPVLAKESGALGDPDAFFDPFCLIAALAPGVAMPCGTCVTDSIRRGAADLARIALTLHQLCPGGFKLGIGSGEAENLLPFGYDFSRPVARTESVLKQLRQLLDEGTFPGTNGRLGLPRETEAGRPEIWLAAHGPRMLGLTGRYADGWLPAFLGDADAYATKLAEIRRHAADAQRPVPEAGLQPFVIIGESRERLRDQFETQPLAKLFTLFLAAPRWEPHGLEHPAGPQSRGFVDVIVHDLDVDELRALAPTIPFELISEAIVMGNVEEITAQIEPYARAGTEHLIIGNLTGLVGGASEAAARAPDFPRLAASLRAL
jgi:phthiodiolone/phenolphthiodiolone dimycocerosates ketoreductase